MEPNFFQNSFKMLTKNRHLILTEGCLFSLLGILAICAPVVFTIGLDILFGALFIIGGVVQLFRVFKVWGVKGSWPSLFWSCLTLFAGAVMLTNPMIGIVALTSVLIAFFLLEGILKFVLASHLDKGKNKFWVVFSGILSCFLAVLIFTGLPGTAAWALGLIVGIDLLFFGLLLISFYCSLSKENR